ncbi:GGDEF domain-containing protein [Paractinoplanes brasiliensis]|uniref:Diguanylate cyclase (GGDEF)-like protein n=1 Tax=Paractinoplanes brasiliensis TaxID=52695 RepID=A0A4V3C8L7_9ACTN|nr:GGDEF domain-containing protein [Actinoplanes brasiliensis]TDO42088.1 diguanylate cyclase (GGDEF)-like protein [Actinoplanes brasiliensis]GID33037.1 hypothetical protein Abr02nite_80200 [Actinoplanes brasiliensis]
MASAGNVRTAGRVASAALAAVSGVLIAVLLLGSAAAEHAVMLTASLTALAAVATGLRVHQVPDRRPWLLVLVGLGLLTVVNTLPWVSAGVPVAPFQISGYLALLAASLLIVWRRTPRDRGGVIDAAIVGIATAAPVWEFVLRPALVTGGVGAGGQVVVLVQLLVLTGILGALLRVTRTSGRRAMTVWLLFGALSCAVAGDVVFTTTGGSSGLLYLGGYLLVGAAALHPTVATLTHPVTTGETGVPKLRLGLFGFALIVVPLVGGVPQLYGEAPDGLLLTLGPLAMVPLVLVRAGQLIAQRAQDQRDLAYQANHDDLTGLVNRRRLFTVMAQATAAVTPAAVLYCDLDDFKPINDRYGHEAGDEVLRCVGRRLVEVLRDGDVTARIGGDEFLAYCPDADEATASGLRRRVEEALHAPIPWNGVTLQVGVTVGVLLSEPGAYTSPDELVAAADAVMYERKRIQKAERAVHT